MSHDQEPDLPKIFSYSQLDDYDEGDRVWIPTRIVGNSKDRGAIVEIVEHREVDRQ